ncbi:hypothetical protein HAX54_002691 [Datura stramonium]|uniref:Uncharacterized protein n=1 Tax=Datura stramonium TaxID=4076 RepID=A0ABS8RT90_DATST|nr:hypothetical protein [Datura stramonium]
MNNHPSLLSPPDHWKNQPLRSLLSPNNLFSLFISHNNAGEPDHADLLFPASHRSTKNQSYTPVRRPHLHCSTEQLNNRPPLSPSLSSLNHHRQLTLMSHCLTDLGTDSSLTSWSSISSHSFTHI